MAAALFKVTFSSVFEKYTKEPRVQPNGRGKKRNRERAFSRMKVKTLKLFPIRNLLSRAAGAGCKVHYNGLSELYCTFPFTILPRAPAAARVRKSKRARPGLPLDNQ